MLVLSRKSGEEIAIGCDIHLNVIAVRGNRVVLGITAPPDTQIRRAELPASAALTKRQVHRPAGLSSKRSEPAAIRPLD
jgi:carbon storage regulator CsrA